MKASRRKILEAPINVDLPLDALDSLRDFGATHRIKIKSAVVLAFRELLATHPAVKKCPTPTPTRL